MIHNQAQARGGPSIGIGVALRYIGTAALAVAATRAFQWSMASLAIGSQVPSSSEVKEVIESTGAHATKLKNLIGSIVILLALVLFATPLKKMVTKLVNRIKG